MFKIHKEEIEINGKKISLETGKIARQADGAIIATCGETVVIATAVGAKKLRDGQDFFPLSIHSEVPLKDIKHSHHQLKRIFRATFDFAEVCAHKTLLRSLQGQA